MIQSLSFLVCALLIILCGCNQKSLSVLNNGIDCKDITLIQASASFNDNPSGKNTAKFITDAVEIANIVKALQDSQVGEEVDILYGNTKVIRLFSGDRIVNTIAFYYTDAYVFSNGSKCYKCTFHRDDPWRLFADSNADTVYVDNRFNIVDDK
jgi:hypothetical protein